MSLSRESVVATVSDILAGIAPDADLTTVDPAGNLREQLDLDSMDFLGLVTRLHERTGVAIPEADYRKVGSLDALVAYVQARAGG